MSHWLHSLTLAVPAIEACHGVDDGERDSRVHVGAFPAAFDGALEGNEFVPDSLAVQLVEVTLVQRGVLEADFKVIRFPLGGGRVDVAFRAGDYERAL